MASEREIAEVKRLVDYHFGVRCADHTAREILEAAERVRGDRIDAAIRRVWENEHNHLIGTPLFFATVEAAARGNQSLLDETAVKWVLEDGKFKAPEEWNWLCKRWYERLSAAYGE